MDDKELLWQRYQECEQIILDIHAGKVVDGDPAELEGQMLLEQDLIEGKLGEIWFEERDKQAD
ncbi:hypothetical protein [Blastopirellula marina]|uniref:Uncharacterized protein n=1 Tax=Blastopirellula marina TaxID=124 RepID=A0A2S8GTM2_9BACT|nr:hypothetical protein [Blastopirellula marina]PQO47414.1 hypothetical protein C5Y93_05050 [Blastopirellula marina]